jgi:hypothetical protein
MRENDKTAGTEFQSKATRSPDHYPRWDFFGHMMVLKQTAVESVALGMIRQVLLSCFPAVVPLLIMQGQKNSRRAFSTMLPAKFFGVGWHWACVTDANEPIVRMALMLPTGIGMVGVAILQRG